MDETHRDEGTERQYADLDYEMDTNRTCDCLHPIMENREADAQEGGEIVSQIVGKWCRRCDSEYVAE